MRRDGTDAHSSRPRRTGRLGLRCALFVDDVIGPPARNVLFGRAPSRCSCRCLPAAVAYRQAMPITVYDYRTDLRNLVVQPQIRSRFRVVELGPVPQVHSHDLGGETFVVLQGHIEFTVGEECVVAQQGQAIYVAPRTTHAVRAVGDKPGVIYLSVSPHVEPTHTIYAADGTQLPPRYGVWREAGGGEAVSQAPRSELALAYRQAAHTLAELARANANAAAGIASTDELWAALLPLLRQVEDLERTWNALAECSSME